jgi:hypothetical protein
MDSREAMEQAETPEQVQYYQDIDALAGVMLEDQKFYTHLSSLYQFSEAYEAEWNEKWTQYDAMEPRRIEVGAQRLDWQEIVEKWRDEDRKLRIEYVDSVADIMGKVPLYYALHVYVSEQLDEELELDRLHSWRMAMRDWSRFRELYESSENFRGHLSPTQQTSFRILDDWWNSRYSAASDMEDFVASVEELSPVASVALPTSSGFPYTWTSHSYYHTYCMELFFREFHAMEWEPHVPRPKLLNLMAARESTARHAIHMRFAWATHRSLVLKTPKDEEPRLPEYMKPVREMDFWKDNIYFQEPQPGDVAQEGYLEKMESLTDPPLYLWDVQEKKTVRTSDFERCPDYMCVSHTWGRWTYRPPQMVQVPNVPWEIKGNTLYDVRDVPDMLLGLNTEYVWLDLFCLPQDDSPDHHKEVANQTAIFRRSKACVAWLNDVEEWAVTSAALNNIGLRYLRNTCIHPDLEVSDEVIEATYDAAHGPSELLKPGMLDEPSSWFSSLWTLQETVLCPNLRLCTRTMDVLSDEKGTPISLSTLLTLVEIPRRRPTIPTKELIGFQNIVYQIPPACQTLSSLSHKTQLGWVMRLLSPIDVMINANLRACKRSRAVAIMSALDVVEWYKERKPDKDGKVSSTGYDDDELILETFPLSFVREAARKFGSAFYTAMSDMNAYRMEKFDTLTGFGDYQVGSMMPFTKNHGWVSSVYAAITFSQLRKRDHESVATWVIQENAGVRIRQAGILASSEDAPQEDKPIEALVTIMRSEKVEGRERNRKIADTDPKADLRAKLKELAGKKSVYYAVVLSDDFGQQFGLVLQTAKIRLPTPGIKRYLCKVGIFWTLQMTDPVPSTKVNWVVA